MRAHVLVLVLLLLPMYNSPAFFSNIFTPESLMGAGPASRPPPPNTPPGFSDQSPYVSLTSAGALVAVGDFNRDRFVDLVVLDTATLKRASILFWDHEAFAFRHRGSGVTLSLIEPVEKTRGIAPMGNVRGVHVADFDNDGALDLLLHDGKQGRVFLGDGAGAFNHSNFIVIPELPMEHALVDADADLIPDLFVAFRNGSRGFWTFENKNNSVEPRYHDWEGGRHKGGDGNECIVADPVSIAFVDMDGDCLPDLVVPTTCGLEVWSNPADSGRKFWELSSDHTEGERDVRLLGLDVFNMAHGDRSVAFADFNSDGTIDIAVPNRNRQDLLIHLNRQVKRKRNSLCEGDQNWHLDRRTGVSTGLNMKVGKVGHLFGSIEVPPSLHIGDYDLDGMPDIMVIDASGKPALFRNEGNWNNKHVSDSHFKRVGKKAEETLTGRRGGAVTGMFFDTDESGRQDFLIVRGGNETRLVWNNLQKETDSLFFKGTILSGLSYRQEPRPFAPVTGSTIKLSYMERGSREKVTRVCSQCSQSGHWQLRPCNCQFGLMHIANYIEELWAGAGAGRRAWANLMPNSMAVVWAEKGGTVEMGDSSSWWMEYFTQRRGSQMLRVSALLVLALAVLGVAIMVLQHQERKEDRDEDERERVRLFNFV